MLKLGHGINVLAVVPVDPPPDNRPIALSRPNGSAVEAYRSLRTNVQFIGFERDTQVIEVTGAVPGEAKTTTTTNLAAVLSQTGSSVVLVDADLRKPRVARGVRDQQLQGPHRHPPRRINRHRITRPR